MSQWYKPEMLGTAPYVSDLSEWFVEKGYNVHVLTQRPVYPSKKRFPEYDQGRYDKENINGVDIWRTKSREIVDGALIERAKSEFSFFFQGVFLLLTRKVKRSNLTISFCPSIFSVLLGSLFTKKNGIHLAVVHDIQSGLAESLEMTKGSLLILSIKKIEKNIFRRASRIIVLTEEMKQILNNSGIINPISVLPIWVDFRKIYPVDKKVKEFFTIMYCGNLGRKQGLNQILDLAEELQKRCVCVTISIRGGGSQKEILKSEVIKRKINNIVVGGSFDPVEFNQGLSEADIHIVPQNKKTSSYAVPSKIYTILAARKPVICTAEKDSTLDKISKKSEGLIVVEPDNPKIFADAVIKLMENSRYRENLAHKGYKYVKKYCDRIVILNEYDSLLSR